MKWIAKNTKAVLAILLFAFALRMAAGYWWQSRLPEGKRFAFGDSASYWALAQTIARGEPYEYGTGMRIFRMPGYPLLLAALCVIRRDEPPVMWARAVGALLGTMAVGGIMVFAAQAYDSRTAILAGSIAALYPGAISLSVFVLSEALFCPLLLLQFICWIAALRRDSAAGTLAMSVLGGIASGCATLTRPSWLLFTPGAVALAVMVSRDRRRHILVGAFILLTSALTLLPWWVRNYRVCGRFVPTTLQVGASLYDGMNPQANGASDMYFVGPFFTAQREYDRQHAGLLSDTFEYRLDQRFRRAALGWMKQEPRRVAELLAIKFYRMWSPWPNADDMQSWTFRLVLFFGYTPLIVLAAINGSRSWRRGWPYLLCLLPALYFTFLHVVFVSSIRYREPAMLTLIVLAAGLIREMFAPAPLTDR